MYRDRDKNGVNPSIVIKSKTQFEQPLKLKQPSLIFTCSWSDWFIEEADVWRNKAWEIIRRTPQHTYQILTKRPERIKANLPNFFDELSNVWIGVSVENQQQVYRIGYLKNLLCVTFVSFEPLIGEIKWDNSMNHIDWCIIGGESGYSMGKYGYRPMKLEWLENVITGAKENNVKCFVKQLGTYQSKLLQLKDLHGGNMEEWDEKFQIRECPESKPRIVDLFSYSYS